MTGRKIVGVFGLGRRCRSLPHDSFAVHHSDGGMVTCGHDYVRSLLPRCGQRVDHLPEVGEMVIPEDIPTPVPLPDLVRWAYDFDGDVSWRDYHPTSAPSMEVHVATLIVTDAIATIVRVTP